MSTKPAPKPPVATDRLSISDLFAVAGPKAIKKAVKSEREKEAFKLLEAKERREAYAASKDPSTKTRKKQQVRRVKARPLSTKAALERLEQLAEEDGVAAAAMQAIESKARVTRLALDVQKAVDQAAARRGSAEDPKTRQAVVLTESVLFDRQLALHTLGILHDLRARYLLKAEDVAEELGVKASELLNPNKDSVELGFFYRYCAAIMKLHPSAQILPGDLLEEAFDKMVRGMPVADRPSWERRQVAFSAPLFVEWMRRKNYTAPQLAKELRAFRPGLTLGSGTVREWMNGKPSANPRYMDALFDFSKGEVNAKCFVQEAVDPESKEGRWRQAMARRV